MKDGWDSTVVLYINVYTLRIEKLAPSWNEIKSKLVYNHGSFSTGIWLTGWVSLA